MILFQKRKDVQLKWQSHFNLRDKKDIVFFICSILLSEENDDIILVDDSKKYIVAFDPLDGSSNIDCNCCVGTIFCVFEDNHASNMSERILRKGDEIICAGYVLYGPATEFVITTGNGVQFKWLCHLNSRD